MPWDDKIFRDAVDAGAKAIGKSRSAVLREAGISTETFNHPPDFGRRTDVFARLAPVLGWSDADQARILCEAMGLDVQIVAVANASAHAEANGSQAAANAAAVVTVSATKANSRGKIQIFMENVEISVATLNGHDPKAGQ